MMAHALKQRVLVAEVEEGVREHLASFLGRLGHAVDVVRDEAGVLDKLAASDYHLLLLDERIAGKDLIARLTETHRSLGVIVMASTPAFESVIAAMRSRASDYVVKPFALNEVTAAVNRVLGRQQTSLGTTTAVETDFAQSTKDRQAASRRQVSEAENGANAADLQVK